LGQYFVDSFWEMPKLNYLTTEELLKFCKKNNIGLIIPTRDGELEYFSKLKDKLNVNNINIMISEAKSIERTIDKLSFANLKNIKAIPASTDINDLIADTYVVKERYGAGSKSIGIDLKKSEALLYATKLENPIFQPYIKGYEISVDAYITRSGKIKGLVMRKRDLVVSGESQITTTFYDESLESAFENIIASLNLYGHIILQAIIDVKKEIHLIECNARFGGASTLSLQAGLDSFYWAYLESQGISIEEDYPFIRSDKKIIQIRHPQDLYL
jgi:carbamoyl-phosphate synthase large subunit